VWQQWTSDAEDGVRPSETHLQGAEELLLFPGIPLLLYLVRLLVARCHRCAKMREDKKVRGYVKRIFLKSRDGKKKTRFRRGVPSVRSFERPPRGLYYRYSVCVNARALQVHCALRRDALEHVPDGILNAMDAKQKAEAGVEKT
jgi:hypothetical protein